jgi:hypothetical protein
MRKLYLIVSLLALVVMVGLTSCAYTAYGQQQPYPSGPGGGVGPGMMGGRGGMMGRGWGNNYNSDPNAKQLTIDQVADKVSQYLNNYGGNLVLTEVMDFSLNYYAEVQEKDTGIHAMELLIDKYTGRISPEMGPNTMWNTKYSPMGGMMGSYGGGSPTANMPVSPDQAEKNAQQYLDTNLPGLTVTEADNFYGYYTLHTLNNNQVEGMLSVNGYTGAVWYHSWHGVFIDMKEFE